LHLEDFPRYSCVVNPDSDVRDALKGVFVEQSRIIDQLLRSVGDPAVSAAQIAYWVEWIERLDSQRDELIRSLRDESTEVRKREEERSVRQFVLRALDEIGMPQNSGFVQDYAWARYGVDLNTRGFGSLRRDERRSWSRSPTRRLAYIVPTLDDVGRAVARWMARSDWPIEQRITLPGPGERLLDLHKIRALISARMAQSDQQAEGDPLALLIDKYGQQVLRVPMEIDDDRDKREARFAQLQHVADNEYAELSDSTAKARMAVADRLTHRSEEEKLWGAPTAASGRSR
jgi:hypothetical protein